MATPWGFQHVTAAAGYLQGGQHRTDAQFGHRPVDVEENTDSDGDGSHSHGGGGPSAPAAASAATESEFVPTRPHRKRPSSSNCSSHPCRVDGCPNNAGYGKCDGLCPAHYRQANPHLPPYGTKFCCVEGCRKIGQPRYDRMCKRHFNDKKRRQNDQQQQHWEGGREEEAESGNVSGHRPERSGEGEGEGEGEKAEAKARDVESIMCELRGLRAEVAKLEAKAASIDNVSVGHHRPALSSKGGREAEVQDVDSIVAQLRSLRGEKVAAAKLGTATTTRTADASAESEAEVDDDDGDGSCRELTNAAISRRRRRYRHNWRERMAINWELAAEKKRKAKNLRNREYYWRKKLEDPEEWRTKEAIRCRLYRQRLRERMANDPELLAEKRETRRLQNKEARRRKKLAAGIVDDMPPCYLRGVNNDLTPPPEDDKLAKRKYKARMAKRQQRHQDREMLAYGIEVPKRRKVGDGNRPLSNSSYKDVAEMENSITGPQWQQEQKVKSLERQRRPRMGLADEGIFDDDTLPARRKRGRSPDARAAHDAPHDAHPALALMDVLDCDAADLVVRAEADHGPHVLDRILEFGRDLAEHAIALETLSQAGGAGAAAAASAPAANGAFGEDLEDVDKGEHEDESDEDEVVVRISRDAALNYSDNDDW